MKNIVKYIFSMLDACMGITIFLWIWVVIFCGITQKGLPSINECFLIYVLIYIATVVFVVFEVKPYDEWIDENQ